jgi:hypothetical protein
MYKERFDERKSKVVDALTNEIKNSPDKEITDFLVRLLEIVKKITFENRKYHGGTLGYVIRDSPFILEISNIYERVLEFETYFVHEVKPR